jgi:putative membrane protein
MNRIVAVTATLAVALLGWVASGAEDSAGGSILNQVHQINLAEIQEGQLAEQNGQSKQVKSYGKTLVRDHEKADAEVQKEAKKLGLTFTPEQTADQQNEIQQLQTLTGSDFDRQFVKDEVAGHQKAISMVKDALPQVQSSGEKKTLDKIMPLLKKHLKIAEKLERQMGQSASAD